MDGPAAWVPAPPVLLACLVPRPRNSPNRASWWSGSRLRRELDKRPSPTRVLPLMSQAPSHPELPQALESRWHALEHVPHRGSPAMDIHSGQCSEGSVEYASNILSKQGVSNRTEATTLARRRISSLLAAEGLGDSAASRAATAPSSPKGDRHLCPASHILATQLRPQVPFQCRADSIVVCRCRDRR